MDVGRVRVGVLTIYLVDMILLSTYSIAGRLPRKRILCAKDGAIVLGGSAAPMKRATLARVSTTLSGAPDAGVFNNVLPVPFGV